MGRSKFFSRGNFVILEGFWGKGNIHLHLGLQRSRLPGWAIQHFAPSYRHESQDKTFTKIGRSGFKASKRENIVSNVHRMDCIWLVKGHEFLFILCFVVIQKHQSPLQNYLTFNFQNIMYVCIQLYIFIVGWIIFKYEWN